MRHLVYRASSSVQRAQPYFCWGCRMCGHARSHPTPDNKQGLQTFRHKQILSVLPKHHCQRHGHACAVINPYTSLPNPCNRGTSWVQCIACRSDGHTLFMPVWLRHLHLSPPLTHITTVGGTTGGARVQSGVQSRPEHSAPTRTPTPTQARSDARRGGWMEHSGKVSGATTKKPSE